MLHLAKAGWVRWRDEVPELPLGPSIAGAYANAALHNHTHHQHSSSAESQYSQSQSPGTSPVLPHSPGPQMHSPPTHHASPHAGSHSNVDLTMFDPEGMNRLGRTLSRMSQEQHVGESDFLYPECQWVYELELPVDVVPQPKDGEVAEARPALWHRGARLESWTP